MKNEEDLSEQEIEEILKHFDDLFAIKVNKHIKNKIQFLKLIYDRFEEVLTKPNKSYLNLAHKDIELTDELSATLNKEQSKIFEKHLDTINRMCALENKQLFYFGYILAKTLEQEGKMSSE